MVRTELEIRRELANVQRLLQIRRGESDDDTFMLHGAEQTLLWILGKEISQSEVEGNIEKLIIWSREFYPWQP